MFRQARVLLAVLVTGLASAALLNPALPASAAETAGVVLRQGALDGEPVRTVQVTVPPGSDSASVLVFLSGAQAGQEVALRADLAGPGGLVPATFDHSPVVVPQDPGRAPVRITVSGLSKTGTYTGDVLAVTGGSATSLAELMVTKRDDPAVVVDGTGADGRLTLNTPGQELRASVQLRSTTPAATTGMQLQVSQSVDSSGVPHPLGFESDAGTTGSTVVDLPASGTRTVTLVGLAPVAGDYTATFSFVRDGATTTLPLTVHRVRTAPSVAVDEVGTPTAEAPPWSTMTLRLRLLLRETDNQPLSLQAPQVVGLLRDQRGLALTDGFDPPVLMADDGSRLPELRLDPNEKRTVLLELRGLRHPGKYSGSVRLAGQDGPVVDKTWTAYLAWPAWCTGVLIAGGALVALLLRSVVLPTAQGRHARLLVARLRDQLRATSAPFVPLRPAESAVLRSLDRALAGMADASGPTGALWERTVRLAGRWLTAQRQLDGRPGLPDKGRDALATVTGLLSGPSPTAEAVAAAESAMDMLEPLAQEAFRERLLAAVAGLAAESGQLEAHARQGRHRDRLRGVADLAKRLAADLEGGRDPNTAAGEYSRLRGELAATLRDDLRAAAARETAPLGVDPERWSAVRAEVIRRLVPAGGPRDGEPDLDGLEAAERLVAETIADGVSRADREAAGATGGLPDTRMFALVDDTTLRLERGRPAQPRLVLDLGPPDLLDQLARAAGGDPPDKVRDIPAGRLPTALVAPRIEQVPEPTSVEAKSKRRLTAEWLLLEAVGWALVAALAVAFGVTVLWSPGWGGWWDATLAVLWGAGLYQVAGGSAFAGLASLRAPGAPAPAGT